MAHLAVHILRRLQAKLAWAIDKQLQVISIQNVYTTKELKNKVVLSLKQYCICYVVLNNVMYILFILRFHWVAM